MQGGGIPDPSYPPPPPPKPSHPPPPRVPPQGTPNPKTQLRSFVYHQLLVAYLAFVKQLGFEQMLIWACPPVAVRGVDMDECGQL